MLTNTTDQFLYHYWKLDACGRKANKADINSAIYLNYRHIKSSVPIGPKCRTEQCEY